MDASDPPVITDEEFADFQRMIHNIAGIHLSSEKKALVSGRLSKRLRIDGCRSFGDYYRFLMSPRGASELQIAIDSLTTNETYFFREPQHFEFLKREILSEHRRGAPFRVWSAACSSGEEPYSIAMVLDSALGDSQWEVLASDLSTRVLERARAAQYAPARMEKMPREYRRFLTDQGAEEGRLLVDKRIRNRVEFRQINLNSSLPDIGSFDVIFLRNVMIYFNLETKRRVIERMLPLLAHGGYFIVGHSETLHGVTDRLKGLQPSIYRKP